LQNIFQNEKNVLLYNNNILLKCSWKNFSPAEEVLLFPWGKIPFCMAYWCYFTAGIRSMLFCTLLCWWRRKQYI